MSSCSSFRSYWKVNVPPEDILFVASANSPQFVRLIAALDNAYMVGLDAEWKPVRSHFISPRVAILQLSVRYRTGNGVGAGADQTWKGGSTWHSRSKEAELQVDRHSGEAIFLLDMLALPPAAFSAPMKLMLSSRNVLKLGFGFRQDLLHLAASFPGPEAHGCFDKVEPYLDVGKLYCQLRGRNSMSKPGKGLSNGRESSLSAICEAILGLPLCKNVQCSNWESRPLRPEQITYAAADAHCLLVLVDSFRLESIRHIAEERGKMVPSPEMTRSALIGLAILLEEANGFITGSILRPRRGIAQEMVEEAIATCFSTNNHSTSGTLSLPKDLLEIARWFGERLLVNEQGSRKKTASKKKNRVRQPREVRTYPLEDQDPQVQLELIQPPPWDPASGGDGVPKFLCDAMVEGLARHLRCVGIDAAYSHTKNSNPRQLVEQVEAEGRVLLTTNVKLLHRRLIPANLSYRVMSSNKYDQLLEVLDQFNISLTQDQLLSRCTKCNGMFSPRPLTAREAVDAVVGTQSLPKCALEADLTFWQCSACQHLYWQGSQFARAMEQFTSVVCHLSTKMARHVEGANPNNTLYLDISV